MDRFEYKVLHMKLGTGLQSYVPAGWFDGDENLGDDIDAAILNRYGAEGWEVCATIEMHLGMTSKIVLQRPLAA